MLNGDVVGEDAIFDKMIVNLNMLSVGVEDRVVYEIDCRDIVTINRCQFR